ncbi:50S ribosomal protein L21 [Candidatus Peregrinibacteria bacterium]|nr:50S ribosomal protein L21 [Candidatus Peregrinibacteria bacterium]
MFAILEKGGKQYKIQKGEMVNLEKIQGKEGTFVNFDKVLLISDKGKIKVGSPYIKGASATGKIISHNKNDKIRVFKMKPKKRYQKTQGHRQIFTTIEITDIKGKSVKTSTKTVTAKTTSKSAAKPKTSTGQK